MLVYVSFFILSFSGGVLSHCTPPACDPEPTCPDNEHYTRNNPRCIRTCANKWVPISYDCKPFTGCACDGDLVRLKDDGSGPCIPSYKCPCRNDPKNPEDQIYTARADAVGYAEMSRDWTVSDLDGSSFGHFNSKSSSLSSSSSSYTSVISSDCGGNRCSDPNAVYKECPNPCPLTCSQPNPRPCIKKCLKSGCECAPGFLLNEVTGRCVRPKDCPGNKCRDPNAIFKQCPNPCPLTCDRPFPRPCSKACIKEGCECAPGFLLEKNDMYAKCIRPNDCPVPIRCPKNECYVMNDNQCQKTCGNRLLPNSDTAGACVPFTGCICEPGYVRKYDNATGPCIRERKCPPIPTQCDVNEVPTSCRIICPPQTCDSIFSSYYCLPTECEPGCDCLNGYLRNSDGDCIPSDDCFKPDPTDCGPNEVPTDCAIVCPPQSCESLFTTYLCAESNCTPGCNCIDGYLRNSLGICVPSDDCYDDPAGCDGDLNAVRVRDCGNACPPTCAVPEPEVCPTICILNGCECKPGYILSEQDGVCIEPGCCPGGSPCCGANKTYVGCKFGCPTNYCPADDSRAQVACSPPYPCQGGCACKAGYLIISRDDPRCVLASDCPEVDCTRPNEIWDPKPSSCFLERCDERGKVCDYPYPTGPRCVCKEGYYRNESDICIPASECPPLGCKGDLNATLTSCPTPCPKTCADPNAGSEGCIEVCLPEGCQCNPGYVLTTKDGGVCIKPQDCPDCNGDPRAVFSECPTACEPTCAKPDPDQACTFQCLPPGCVCRPGFVLSEEGGKCIKPENCPACNGDPYAVFSECPSACEPTCANPSPEICTLQCLPPGCICKPGYVLSEKGGKCIKPEKCPACNGDPYAVYSECPSACEPTCANPNPEICTLQCLPPGCVCKPGYVRTDKCGKCIKPENCPDQGCNGDRNATYKECPSACPLTCAEQDPNRPCIAMCAPSGCECNPGYVLEDGKCIKPEDCPVVDDGCNGDLNATRNDCPSSCPTTCGNRNSKAKLLCPDVCDPSGCECKPGYILTEKGGICIKPEDCPDVDVGCNGDLNATYSECPSSCPTTCANRFNEGEVLCPAVCDPSFCTCKPGYILTEKGGICIKPEDCPEPGCEGDSNAEYSDCPSACQATCDNPDTNQPCTKQCLPPGCVCKTGFIRIEKEGKCIKPENCPDQSCNGDPNAVYSTCPSACEPTCSNQDPQICTLQCLPPGCVCKPGYVLSEKDGICVKPENCPDQGCNGDPNAVYSTCPSACEPTCSNPDPQICTLQCLPPGCVCKPGYVLLEKGGICIKPENCPGLGCNGDLNATYTECRSACPRMCGDDDSDRVCPAVCKPPGCQCNPGYVLNEDGKCILPEDCPGCEGDPNAEYSDCPGACQATCDNPDTNQPCTEQCLPPDCVCKTGFIRIENEGKCIKPENCPDQGCNGDPNAVYSTCPSACEPTCSNPDPQICTLQCLPPGCVCKPGYVLSEKDGICVKPENCPDQGCNGDPNAVYSTCPSACEPTCSNQDPQICTLQCLPPGCVCKPGYVLLEKGGICIKPENCPGLGCNGDLNATYTECRSACPRMCGDEDSGRFCPAVCKPPGCQCNPGYVLNEDGKCILPEDCPPELECNGDRNATHSDCPTACPATCRNPDAEGPCIDMCMPPGCVCKPGYLLTKPCGRCIQPEDCPGGSPRCGVNETYVYCKVGCPTNYCPVDDSRDIIACDPTDPCPGGCACKGGYLMLSEEDDRCILSSECPPVKCTRDNEVWDPNAPGCLHESCDDKDIPCDFQYPGPPRCVCIEGYYRNQDDVCVPESQCPALGCEGDPNATFSECPSECPATCCEPDSDRPCITSCAEPGCVCNEGYILSEPGGLCIRPYDCPGGSPHCCDNMTYVSCKIDCPMKYCPESEDEITIICDPVWPCPSGCVCKQGYLMKNTADRTCILAADCPPVECTRPNEVWDPSPSSCNFEKCDEMYYICGDTNPGRPKCVCKEGYYKDQNGVCIPAEECPKPQCGYNEVAVPCRQICPPQNCEIAYTDYACTNESKICEPGCDCLPDHLRNGSGICIPNEECPYPSTPVCGINEIARDCRRICPPQTCISKYALFRCVENIPCEPGCDCVRNYLRDSNGICIPSEQCPEPKPQCGYNEVAVPCRQICPPQNCEIAYTDYACTNESKICEPGCDCLPDHLRNGSGICIPNEECPYPSTPVCGINEIARDCRRICPPQTCISKYALFNCVENIPCEPGCDCVRNYLRDSNGICIPSEQCPEPCLIPDECKRTCAEPNPQNCEYNPPKVNMNGCDCKEGYILSELGGDCIPIDECPPELTCNGDPNARVKQCPRPCPSTCDAPNQSPCKRMCEPIGCECKPGFLLSNSTGRCILPDKCPGGNPCGKDGRFVDCKSDCQRDYCPVDDSRNVTCDPPGMCLSGCICDLNHKKKSREDPTCIVSSDCPPVNCTRPNEEWSPCPSACLAENCEDVNNQPTVCNTLVLNCEPACICKKGYFRNSSDICIPAKDCPC